MLLLIDFNNNFIIVFEAIPSKSLGHLFRNNHGRYEVVLHMPKFSMVTTILHRMMHQPSHEYLLDVGHRKGPQWPQYPLSIVENEPLKYGILHQILFH